LSFVWARASPGATIAATVIAKETGLRLPAYSVFAEIADKPGHAKFAETLLWLAKLSMDLPEPADVIERVGKYDDAKLALFNNAQQRDIYWRLSYLLGRYAYENRRYDAAIAELERVDHASLLYGKAQIFAGMANVQARRAVPAVQSFQRVLAWVDDATHPDARLRDLANISIARTYFSAAIHVDESGVPVVDSPKISAAAKYYRRVDVTGEYFVDALFEDSWTRFHAGDYAHALGDLRMLSSPELDPRYAEGGVLGAVILFTTCRYDEAKAAVTKMQQTYGPRRAELARAVDALEKLDDTARLQFVRNSLGTLLSDREVASHLEYVAFIEAEQKRFDQTPATFRSATVANDVRDAIALSREIETRNVGELARARLIRARDELDSNLRDAVKLLIDITAAQRSVMETPQTRDEAAPSTPAAKPTALSWPINGQTTAVDPFAFHVSVTPICGR
jgi:tetratricopeptide (TPR) repeat protein